eukprot:TRINITY_DN31544_c0_g1_i1.p1 TRINITY_DN31544_c0_g1~~TRINITY_DN31544_c0_g1_i1.p1  ORF type:complete len:439 (+),score=23.65 TRINITY_DN31544_c0_g1_i1:49-1365(+)
MQPGSLLCLQWVCNLCGMTHDHPPSADSTAVADVSVRHCVRCGGNTPHRCIDSRVTSSLGYPRSHSEPPSPRSPSRPAHSSSSNNTFPPTSDELDQMNNSNKDRVAGEYLYNTICQSHPSLAAKITGMLLELEIAELRPLIDSRTLLNAKINEALEVLGVQHRGSPLPRSSSLPLLDPSANHRAVSSNQASSSSSSASPRQRAYGSGHPRQIPPPLQPSFPVSPQHPPYPTIPIMHSPHTQAQDLPARQVRLPIPHTTRQEWDEILNKLNNVWTQNETLAWRDEQHEDTILQMQERIMYLSETVQSLERERDTFRASLAAAETTLRERDRTCVAHEQEIAELKQFKASVKERLIPTAQEQKQLSAAELDDEIEKMQAQIGTMQQLRKEGTLCVICFENPKEVVFLPCKHLCACSKCSSKLDSCPECRANIAERIKPYM